MMHNSTLKSAHEYGKIDFDEYTHLKEFEFTIEESVVSVLLNFVNILSSVDYGRVRE